MSLAIITGASGLLGGNLAVELLRQGHAVRATRRGSTKVAHLEGHRIEWVAADLDDPRALTEAFRGADVVFHCAAQVSILEKPTALLVRANVEGTRNVLQAAREAKIGRLVHCSTVGAVGLSDDGKPSTEAQTWNFEVRGMADGYVITKHQAELLVAAAAREEVDAVIVNPTYMLGPLDSRPSSGKLIIDLVRGKVPGRTPGMNNFVDARDVARGMIQAWKQGKRGERYILGGENLSYGEIADRVAKVANLALLRWNIPRALATPIGWLGDAKYALGLGEGLINSVAVRYGYCPDFIFSSEKAKRELGYLTGPLEQAIRDAIEWFRQVGMLPRA